jgi:hypothetical protein
MSDPTRIEPGKPEPSADATQEIPVGEPASPYSTQRLNVANLLEAEGTLKMPLPILASPAEQTQRFERPLLAGATVPVQISPAPEVKEPPVAMAVPPPPTGSRSWQLPLGLALLALVGGGAGYVLLSRPSPTQAPSASKQAPEVVPPGAQAYLEQAKAGDANAMRMLGVMYYYGLNVPQDREKGLYWYRQAASKGSETARAELVKLEAAGK